MKSEKGKKWKTKIKEETLKKEKEWRIANEGSFEKGSKGKKEWTNKWMNEWMSKWMNEWVNE